MVWRDCTVWILRCLDTHYILMMNLTETIWPKKFSLNLSRSVFVKKCCDEEQYSILLFLPRTETPRLIPGGYAQHDPFSKVMHSSQNYRGTHFSETVATVKSCFAKNSSRVSIHSSLAQVHRCVFSCFKLRRRDWGEACCSLISQKRGYIKSVFAPMNFFRPGRKSKQDIK